ncbi:MAG: hypothetical protein HWE20_08450 [Gammaproteobacteria bacterium]|nr:hypothetical protein [Gammaproteobacteria bacterium]
MVIDGIDWQVSLSHDDVLTRQVVELQLSATGPESFGRLKLQFPQIDGVQVYPLGMTRHTAQAGTELSMRWLLVPHRDGEIVIDLPEVRYLGGKRPVRYDPPPLRLSVTALPSYLPASTIVGELEWSCNLSADSVLRPGELAVWAIDVQSNSVDPIQFPSVISQLQQHSDIEWLHSTVEYAEVEARPFFGAHYKIAFIVPHGPRLRLPSIEWQQFDPKTRRLSSQRYVAPTVWVFAVWQQVLGMLVLLLGGGVALRRVLPAVRSRFRIHWQHSRLLAAIASTDYLKARHCMDLLATELGMAANLAVDPWLQAWQQQRGKPLVKARELRALEATAFAP